MGCFDPKKGSGKGVRELCKPILYTYLHKTIKPYLFFYVKP